MSEVLVLYYWSYGHLETMANAAAEGARATGAGVDLKRVPETAPLEVAKAAHCQCARGSGPVLRHQRLAQCAGQAVGAGRAALSADAPAA